MRGLDQFGAIAAAILGIPAATYAAPSLGLCGWHGHVGRFDVNAEAPPRPELWSEVARGERLIAVSPLNDPAVHPALYLTDGGWRWRFYAVGLNGSFGQTRPLDGATFINRSDVALDPVNARGYRRTLSGVIAHETRHSLERNRLGVVAAARQPVWAREGYADHVAQESTLDDAAVARLQAAGKDDDPAIFYHDARKRVEAALAQDTSVEALMARRTD